MLTHDKDRLQMIDSRSAYVSGAVHYHDDDDDADDDDDDEHLLQPTAN